MANRRCRIVEGACGCVPAMAVVSIVPVWRYRPRDGRIETDHLCAFETATVDRPKAGSAEGNACQVLGCSRSTRRMALVGVATVLHVLGLERGDLGGIGILEKQFLLATLCIDLDHAVADDTDDPDIPVGIVRQPVGECPGTETAYNLFRAKRVVQI